MSDLSIIPTSELLKSLSDEDLKQIAGIIVPSPEPSPMSAIEGASPWAVGEVPAASETRQMVRPMVQGAAYSGMYALTAVKGKPQGAAVAGGAAAALAGAGVDVLYGKKPDPNEVGWDAALGIGLPTAGAIWKSTVGPYAEKVAGKAAMGLYESAAKILPSVTGEERSKRILTALRDRILPVGQRSIDQLDKFTNEMDDIVGVALSKRTVAGDMISTSNIKDAARSKIAQMKSSSIFGADTAKSLKSELAAVDALPDYITPAKALTYRKDLNKRLTGYFERGKKSGLTTVESSENQFVADVRVNLNNNIYDLIPELRELGKRESAIIGLKQTVERATNRIGNRDILSIGSLVAGGLSESLATLDDKHSDVYRKATYGAGGMLIYSILSRPNVKAQIAFSLAKVGKLTTASPTTLELIGLTKESALKWQPRLKALNSAPTALGTGKADPSYVRGVPAEVQVTGDIGDVIPGAAPSNAAEQLGRSVAERSALWQSANPGVSAMERAYLGYPYKEPLALPPKGATTRSIEMLDDWYKKYSVRPQVR